ncbi:MAG: AI-2E family transporter [Lachnospiraceae bacterium]|nr:AI-2E family transporter [Lachnospiraceae bacterium]
MDELKENNITEPVETPDEETVKAVERETNDNENTRTVWRRLGINKYSSIAVTAFLVIAASILFGYCVINIGGIVNMLGNVVSAASPIICGLVIAYVLKPIYNQMEHWLEHKLLKQKRFQAKPEKAENIAKAVSSITVVLVLFLAIAAVVVIVIPELYKSVVGLTSNLPQYIANAKDWLHGVFKNNPKMDEAVMKYFEKLTDSTSDYLNEWAPQISNIFDAVTNGLGSMMGVLYNIGIGLVLAIYILNEKDELTATLRKIGYSVIREKRIGRFHEELKFADKVFSGFVFARFMDSILLASIYTIIGTLLGLPYVGMTSIIIGITNMIPFFGMYIGLIPCFIILFLISPMDAFIFLIVDMVIMQVDANLISPKIIGNSTGLSGFWVLFALILFGGLWGFFGMLIGVPLFAVIYHQFHSIVDARLKKKNMSTELEDYIRDPVIKKRTKEKRLRERKRAEALRNKIKKIKEDRKNGKNTENGSGDT